MKIKNLLLLAAPIMIAAAACNSTPTYTSVPVAAPVAPQGYEICIGPDGRRVNDLLCDSPHSGYYPDYYVGSGVLLPAYGYAPVGPGWSRNRPNITNITIHNHEPAGGGRVTADPPKPTQAPPTQVRTNPKPTVVPAAPTRNPSVQRGGLGVPKPTR